MTMLAQRLQSLYGKEINGSSDQELYAALSSLIKERAKALPQNQGKKKLYYISAEFLLGRLLTNNLMNLGIYADLEQELASAGISLSGLEEMEPEPSLGNGGLGRLAACFLDSIATLGLNGVGVGLRYHLGLFRQAFENHKQAELPNPWIEPAAWPEKAAFTCPVSFGKLTLQASLYDLDVIGYGGGLTKLHLFDIDTLDEGLVTEGISFDKEDILHNLTLFLYPDDSDKAGHLLRVYQQYFMVSCAAQLILRDMDEAGADVSTLPERAVIQINDTHGSMVIPEMIRLLTERGMDFDQAAELLAKTCAYTNHTVLSEALEKWPLDFIREVAPQLVPILEKLDEKAKALHPDPRVAILDDQGRVHMAHLDIHYGFSVNGVAALHTRILETSEMKPFHDIYPQKFNNKTNGITFRRWLMQANPELTALITSLIGEGWKRDAGELSKLLSYKEDAGVLDALLTIKQQAKQRLVRYLQSAQGIPLDENAVFDIQIKRLHEYKRQQMNALYVIHKYLQIKKGNLPKRPLAVIFGGKAAPAYVLAKDIIHLILCLQTLIQNDPQVSPWLRVVMVENYNVTLAEKLIPACDLSEQISLASKEASGTGNMKLMLNGAVTLGTMDGANVEIMELVGAENIFIFGESSAEVADLYARDAYRPGEIYQNDPDIRETLDFLLSGELRAIGDSDSLSRLQGDILTRDWFMALLDLKEYIRVKEQALSAYEDRRAWAQRMLVNTAMAGFFSSDRAIAQYNQDIWRLDPAK